MTAADFVLRLGAAAKAKKTAHGWQCRCPAHEDRNPSLAVSDGDRGVVVFCHSQKCTTDDICRAAGIQVADLFNGEKKSGSPKLAKAIDAEYSYTDEQGVELFQAVRFEPKDFRQRRRVNGQWVWNLEGIRRVPYRLPELLKAIADKRTVFIPEGEKDCDALVARGFVATCNPMGAGKWPADFAQYFKGADVCIIADKDEPGRKHTQDVASKLPIVSNIRVIEMPGDGIKDVSDWFAAGGEAAELDELVQAAPLWKPSGNLPEGFSEPSNVLAWLEYVQDGADIALEELPAVIEIVEGIVANQSKLVIGSGSKSFKTWLTMMMALCIAHGIPFLGRATTRCHVLYANLELKPATFKRRLQTIAKALGIEIDRSWFLHLPLRGHMSGLTAFELVNRLVALAKHFAAGVVVLDPVYKANTEGEENSSRDQTRFFNQLDRVTTEAGCTLILNDHFGKGNQSEKDPLDAIRGSSAKGGDVDAAMVLRKHTVENCLSVDIVHRELAPVEPFTIGWNYPLMELRPDLDPGDMKKAGGRKPEHEPKTLLKPIADTTAGNPISISAWATKAKVSRQTLQGYTDKFRTKGWISTVGEGNTARQFITPEGLKLL